MFGRAAIFLVVLAAAAAAAATTTGATNDFDEAALTWPRTPPEERMTIANCTCRFFKQPLNHFGDDASTLTFPQRYCVHDEYFLKHSQPPQEDDDQRPIFLYVGNEAPVDEYVNNTGLMWELAPQFHALVVFVEHRFEGKSLPRHYDKGGCLSFVTTSQALADYVRLVSQRFLRRLGERPVIAFGGSYGGMLAAWIRMKYPHIVTGAIAASAPLGAFPLESPPSIPIDNAYRVLTQSLLLPLPPVVATAATFDKGTSPDDHPTNAQQQQEEEEEAEELQRRSLGRAHKDTKKKNLSSDEDRIRCPHNLLAVWPLMVHYGRSHKGRQVLQETLRLCHPLESEHDVWDKVLPWAQSLWFDLAEGDFPYPSSYIPYGLHVGPYSLPAWPLQQACHSSGLSDDWGVSLVDQEEAVSFTVTYGNASTSDSVTRLKVDWDTVVDVGSSSLDQTVPAVDVHLLESLRRGVAIWYNVTQSKQCFELIPSEGGRTSRNFRRHYRQAQERRRRRRRLQQGEEEEEEEAQNADSKPVESLGRRSSNNHNKKKMDRKSAAEQCRRRVKKEGSWRSLTCNDSLWIVSVSAWGLGNDFLWPPTLPRNVTTYSDLVKVSNYNNADDVDQVACGDPHGVYGYPPREDPWSSWLHDYYGNLHHAQRDERSNMILTHGYLDPWSSAMVAPRPAAGPDEELPPIWIQNLTDNGSVQSVLLNRGGHHLDLMYSDPLDPPCATQARLLQRNAIDKWIRQWNDNAERRTSSSSSSPPPPQTQTTTTLTRK